MRVSLCFLHPLLLKTTNSSEERQEVETKRQMWRHCAHGSEAKSNRRTLHGAAVSQSRWKEWQGSSFVELWGDYFTLAASYPFKSLSGIRGLEQILISCPLLPPYPGNAAHLVCHGIMGLKKIRWQPKQRNSSKSQASLNKDNKKCNL